MEILVMFLLLSHLYDKGYWKAWMYLLLMLVLVMVLEEEYQWVVLYTLVGLDSTVCMLVMFVVVVHTSFLTVCVSDVMVWWWYWNNVDLTLKKMDDEDEKDVKKIELKKMKKSLRRLREDLKKMSM